jgi:GNAT superfamily N-acetyltransferase
MSVVQRAGCVIADSGLPCGTFNTVFFSGGMWLSTEQFHEVARDIRARFGPFVWWLGPSTIDPGLTSQMEAAGFRYAETEEGMILRLTNGPTLPRSRDEITAARVQTPEDLEQFAAIIAANWQPEDRNIIEFYRQIQQAVLAPGPMRLFLGYWCGEPVGTCEVLIVDGVAGIYSVATRAEYRGRGIATALIIAAVQEAVREGCSLACLEASEESSGLYRRLGFRPCGKFLTFE